MVLFEPQLTSVIRADHLAGPPQGAWTPADLVRLPDDGYRYEVLEGVLFMTPPPNLAHQRSSGWFGYYLIGHVTLTGLGTVYCAPVGVVLGPKTEVQPDVLVILTGNRRVTVGPAKISGPPDLVIEIASPSTAAYDRDAAHGKQSAYARGGVPEYWLALPDEQSIEVLTLVAGAYTSLGVFRGQERLPSRIVPELPTPAAAFFAPDPL